MKYLRLKRLRLKRLRLKRLRLKHLRLKHMRLKFLRLKNLRLKYSTSSWRKNFNHPDRSVSDWKIWDRKILDWKILRLKSSDWIIWDWKFQDSKILILKSSDWTKDTETSSDWTGVRGISNGRIKGAGHRGFFGKAVWKCFVVGSGIIFISFTTSIFKAPSHSMNEW